MSAEGDRSPGSRSLSKSKSPEGALSGNNSQSPVKSKKTKASKALSRSRTPKRKKHSKKRSHSRSRSGSCRYSRSRSRGKRDSYDEKRSSRRDYSKSRYRRSSSRSPSSRGRRFRGGDRDNPKESRCVGVFGMSLHTDERTIRDVFERYGPLEDVQIVYDYHTGRSRGFAFVYYKYIDDAVEAKENAPGMELDGHKIRVDFSITERAHTPTPGTYMGFKNNSYRSGGGGGRYRRSPSPYRRSGRYRSRSRSVSRGRY